MTRRIERRSSNKIIAQKQMKQQPTHNIREAQLRRNPIPKEWVSTTSSERNSRTETA